MLICENVMSQNHGFLTFIVNSLSTIFQLRTTNRSCQQDAVTLSLGANHHVQQMQTSGVRWSMSFETHQFDDDTSLEKET